jgi:hypothetical protein
MLRIDRSRRPRPVFLPRGGSSANIEGSSWPHLNAVGRLLLAGGDVTSFENTCSSPASWLEARPAVWHVWRTSFAFSYELVGRGRAQLLGYLFAILFLTWGYMSAFLAVIATYFIRDA